MICRKRGKTKRIRAAVALALALSLSAGLLGGCGDDNNNGGSKSVSEAQIGALSYHADGKHFVCLRRSFYSENGRDYYAAEQLTDNSRNIFDLTPGYSCMDGLDSYQNNLEDGFYCFKWENGGYTKSRLVDFGNTGEDYFGSLINQMVYPVSYEDYVYFYIGRGYGQLTDPGARIGRIGKSTGKVELVGGSEITTDGFVISDGWIYFLDSDSTHKGENAGIYKMKTDGSEKTLLHRESFNLSLSVQPIAEYDGFIYYLNNYNSDGDLPCISRVKSDGSGYEKIVKSNEASIVFTNLAVDSGKLYYVDYDYSKSTPRVLNSFEINSKESKENICPDFAGDGCIDIDDGYFYYLSSDLRKIKQKGLCIRIESTDPANPDKYWVRYNIKENFKPEYFYAYKNADGVIQGYFKSE